MTRAFDLGLSDADVLLVVPPPTPSVTPFAAAGYLAASLTAGGFACENVDLGVAMTSWILESGALESSAAARGSEDVPVQMRSGVAGYVSRSELATRAPDAARVFRRPFDDLEAHRDAARIVHAAFPLYSANAGGALSLGSYEHPWPDADLPEIVDELLGPRDVFSSFLMLAARQIVHCSYRLIAISIAHADQTLPALGLAKALRGAGCDSVIAMGGVQIGFLSNELRRAPAFFRHVNLAIPKMGENTIVRLAAALAARESWANIPDVIHLDASGVPVQNGGYADVNISEVPPPDYGRLRLADYLVPKPTLPLRTATKCYWGRCKFCRITGDYQFDAPGTLNAHKLFSDMIAMRARYGCTNFVMADDATAPALLTRLSRLLLAEDFEARWTCIGMRPEPTLTHETLELWARAGCASLAMGFESGSQRLVDVMQKGQRVETVEHILRACRRLGIITFCYGFYGHPLESEDDLRATLEFKLRNEGIASYFAAGRWMLSPYNIDYKETADLGVEVIQPKVFPWGREFWFEWTSMRRAEHESSIERLLDAYRHIDGPRNYLSDWIYWGQGMHIPYDWVQLASRGAL